MLLCGVSNVLRQIFLSAETVFPFEALPTWSDLQYSAKSAATPSSQPLKYICLNLNAVSLSQAVREFEDCVY